MHWLASLFCAEISSSGLKVVVVQVPDHGRPGVVQHPLNDARGFIFVPPEGLEHGSFTVIVHGLCFPKVIIQSTRRTIDGVHRLVVMIEVVIEISGSCVVIPDIVDRPQVIFPKKLLKTADDGNCSARTGLGIKSECTTKMMIIDQPVSRRNVIVRACHLDAGRSGYR